MQIYVAHTDVNPIKFLFWFQCFAKFQVEKNLHKK